MSFIKPVLSIIVPVSDQVFVSLAIFDFLFLKILSQKACAERLQKNGNQGRKD